MITWREGTVRALARSWSGARELTVEVAGQELTALAYPALVGEPRPGDRVLLNVTAQVRGLGTGGYAFVVAIPDRLPPDQEPGPGHIVKARYTPLQGMVLAAEEQESPWHADLVEADDVGGVPVVIADLHSALPAVLAGVRQGCAGAGDDAPRVVYVMTDTAALPVWFSRAAAGLRDAGWLAATISAGQSFGGDYEAVNLHSALLVATRVLHADVVVVAQGPGNVGTGTAWGFSGVATGEAVNAVAALAGTPVAALRVSEADGRPRHRGISHHSLTALTKVALAPAHVAVPLLGGDLGVQVRAQAQVLGEAGHHLHDIPTDDLISALHASPVPLRTMGRGLGEDPASFLAAGAAGILAASFVRRDQRG